MQLLPKLQEKEPRVLPPMHFKAQCERQNGFGGCLFHFLNNQPVTVVFGESALKGYA